MEMMLWILLCLFASVGFVQCGLWFVESLRRPKGPQYGYLVIPIYNDAETLEAQIRYGLSRLGRGGGCGECILLVDMGLDEECQQICEKLLWGYVGVYICDKSDLADTIARLDDLQNSPNDVE